MPRTTGVGRTNNGQTMNTNGLDRWRTLSRERPQTTVGVMTPGQRTGLVFQRTTAGMNKRGYDIDGDGQVDVREMRLAQRLHNITLKQARDQSTAPVDELGTLRQVLGRKILAEEFVTRNQDRLWRYGELFAGQSASEAVDYISTHPKFIRLMPHLEKREREREIRSSRRVRNCLEQGGRDFEQQEKVESGRVTWVKTPRKIIPPLHALEQHHTGRSSTTTSSPFSSSWSIKPESEMEEPKTSSVVTNDYGAVDIDGDGIVDFDEMKLNRELISNVSGGTNVEKQVAGRRMIAQAFVHRNRANLRAFSVIDAALTENENVKVLSEHPQFSAVLNVLKNEERLEGLKSSTQVASCLIDPTKPRTPWAVPTVLTARPVKCLSELNAARIDLNKHLNNNGDEKANVQLRTTTTRRSKTQRSSLGSSKSALVIGSKHIFETPQPIAPIYTLDITK